MPPVTEIGNTHRLGGVRVLCSICKGYVGQRQEECGKAICRDCEIAYYNRPVGTFSEGISMADFIRNRREHEERIFLSIMKRVFYRLQ